PHLSILSLLRLLIPTLFPYTPLFRSGHLVLALFDIGIGELDHLAAIGADKVVVVIAVVQFEDGLAAVELAAGQDAGLLELGEHQDRKSTRLNSSHVKISYAVFCLKKK